MIVLRNCVRLIINALLLKVGLAFAPHVIFFKHFAATADDNMHSKFFNSLSMSTLTKIHPIANAAM